MSNSVEVGQGHGEAEGEVSQGEKAARGME